MLEWAVKHAAALGRSYLRLDCEADRLALRTIYERFGFRLHSYRDVGPYHLSRYEYVIGRRAPRSRPRPRAKPDTQKTPAAETPIRQTPRADTIRLCASPNTWSNLPAS